MWNRDGPPGVAVTIRTGGSPGRSAAAAVSVTSTGPSEVRIWEADRARLARSRDGGEQRLDGRPEGQVDERGQRLARRVPGRRPEQRRRLVVGPPDRPVLFEQEQRDGGLLEMACSSRRSVRTASGSTSFGGMSALAADPGAAAPSASMAASSSMSAASISVRGSAPEAKGE